MAQNKQIWNKQALSAPGLDLLSEATGNMDEGRCEGHQVPIL